MSQIQIEVPAEVQQLWAALPGPIVHYPLEVLRRTASPVGRPDSATRTLVDQMKEAMTAAYGLGLAAPQVAESQRIIIYRLPEERAPMQVIVNPRIISAKGEQTGPEGCLSLPYLHGDVTRAREIIVKGLDMLGRPLKRRASDLEARVIQHEIDHLDGILFIDRADLSTLEWHLPIAGDGVDPDGPVE